MTRRAQPEPEPVRVVSDAERRARLGRRHGLAPEHRFADIGTATSAMTAWHATEEPSIHLAIGARVPGARVADVDSALTVDRALVRQLSMRRTLFALDRRLLPAAIAGPGHRIAGSERRRLVREVGAAGVRADPAGWLADVEAQVVSALHGQLLTSGQLREQIPEVAGRVPVAVGTKWGQDVPLAPRVLTILAADGRVARGPNAGHWRLAKPTWTAMSSWLGTEPLLPDEPTAYAQLVGSWLTTFGPGTEADLVWWFGATKGAVRAALTILGAVPVALEDGTLAWLHAGDIDPVGPTDPWAALLPTLDPSTMGWRGRDFYLHARDVPYVFDSVGNAAPTVWVDGRIVGGWTQDDEGHVTLMLRCALGDRQTELVATEVARLEEFLEGRRVPTTYRGALLRGARLP